MDNLTGALRATLQEAFNTVWQHFVVQQGPPSISGGAGACMYVGPNGARCAFSVLLTSDELSEIHEGDSAGDAIERLNLTRFRGLEEAMNEMQSAHDGAASSHKRQEDTNTAFVIFVERRLRSFADDWQLTVPGSLAAAEPKN